MFAYALADYYKKAAYSCRLASFNFHSMNSLTAVPAQYKWMKYVFCHKCRRLEFYASAECVVFLPSIIQSPKRDEK